MALVTHILQLRFGNICEENPWASISEGNQLLLGLLHLTLVCEVLRSKNRITQMSRPSPLIASKVQNAFRKLFR